MERERGTKAFPVCFLLSSLVFQSLVATVVSRKLEGLGEQKNYYSPDPSNSGSSSGSGGKQSSHRKPCPCETPSHGGGSHGGTPSHGGGYNPSPTPPDPSSGGGYNPSPSTPCGTPTIPSHGGHGSGGHHSSPPSTPVVDTPPGGGYYSPPSTPDPGSSTPAITTPPSPTTPDPNNPPYVPRPCTYWITHPNVIWAIFGYGGTVGGLFGSSAATGFGGNPTLLQALSNTRTDAIGELYREGTTAFINSVATKKFAFTTQQVKDAFLAAMTSSKAAADQAKIFKQANEG